MSIPFEIPIINQDVVNGVSYTGSTLTLTRAEGSDLTTTIATSDPTKIENGTSKMEIATSNGDCVFTPNGDAAKTTTFAADGDIITSGNVGIGDDAPDAPLQIKGDGVTSSSLRIESTNAAGAGYMYIQRNTDGKSYVLNSTNHPLLLGANNDTNQLYLKEDGNVGINDTAPTGGKLCVNGVTYLNGSSTGGLIISRNTYSNPGEREWLISNHVTSGTGTSHLFFRNVNNDTIATDNINFGGDGQIICSGTVTANGVVLSSDDRIKENEKLIVNATEILSKLTPQIYDKYHTMDLSGSSTIESGLIAQEVYYNAPELRHLVVVGKDYDTSGNEYTPTPEEMDLSGVDIANDPDYGSHGWSKTEHSGLHYEGLIPYLIKSNQELAERLAALENK